MRKTYLVAVNTPSGSSVYWLPKGRGWGNIKEALRLPLSRALGLVSEFQIKRPDLIFIAVPAHENNFRLALERRVNRV